MARSRKLRKRESRPRRKTNKRGKKAPRAKTTKRAARRTRVKARRPRRHARVTRRRVHRKKGGTATLKHAYSGKSIDGSGKDITHSTTTYTAPTRAIKWGSFVTKTSPKPTTTTTKSSSSTSSKAFTSAQGNAVAASLNKDSGGMFSASYYKGAYGLGHITETSVGSAATAAIIVRGAYGLYKFVVNRAAVNQPISRTGLGNDMGSNDPDQIGAPRLSDQAGSYGTRTGLKPGFGPRIKKLVEEGKAEQLKIGQPDGPEDDSYTRGEGETEIEVGGEFYSVKPSAVNQLLQDDPKLGRAVSNAISWSQRGRGKPQFTISDDGTVTVRATSMRDGDATTGQLDTNTVEISRVNGKPELTIEGYDGSPTTLKDITAESLDSLDNSAKATLLKAFGVNAEAGTDAFSEAITQISGNVTKMGTLSKAIQTAASDVEGGISSKFGNETDFQNRITSAESELTAATDGEGVTLSDSLTNAIDDF